MPALHTFPHPGNLRHRIRFDVWDSGVSHDEMLGHVSLNLDMALESAIQVRVLCLLEVTKRGEREGWGR